MYKKLIFFALFPVFFHLSNLLEPNIAPQEKTLIDNPIAYLEQERWVDSIYKKMSLDEKIGQLFMIAAYSNKDEKHYKEIEYLVKEHHVGGLIFFQGTPRKQAELTNRYQSKAKVPLLVAIDGEWGLGMRLDSTISYPYQITLGAIEQDSLIEEMGSQIAEQCKRLGIHINFAPVVDINSNPNNPVIGFRSFGESREKVAQKGVAYMKGLQKNGVMAVAKHFPGHGDTDADSHYALPLLKHDVRRLDSLELYPFQKLIEAGVQGVMVAHLNIPAYEKRPNYATTLSENVVTQLLKQKMGFKGLVFTDALNMKGVSSFFKPGEVDVLALLAGNDILLFSGDVPVAVKAIKKILKKKKIKPQDFENRVKKVLRAKFQAGLNAYKPLNLEGIEKDLHQRRYYNLLEQLYAKAVTVPLNQDSLLPFKHLENHQFASVSINAKEKELASFQKILSKNALFEHFQINTQDKDAKESLLGIHKIDSNKTVIVSVFAMSRLATKNFGVDSTTIQLVDKIQRKHKQVVLCLFGNPYALKFFPKTRNTLIAYEENPFTMLYVPQILFGGFSIEGKLPVSVNQLKAGDGIKAEALGRLLYGFSPESVAMSTDTLQKMDTLIKSAIINRVFPGCQVVVVRKGRVVWEKAYGYYDYQGDKKVTTESIYDLASISKVAGTTQALMFLFDMGKLDLSLKASEYLPELRKTNKKNMIVHDIMLHQAGLQPYVLFYKKTLGRLREPSPKFYRDTPNDTFCLQVAPNLFGRKDLEEMIWKWTLETDLLKKKGKRYPYEYSDLSFFILKKIVEKQLNEPMDRFLRNNFYLPMGAYTLCYKPLQYFSPEQIVPTENDKYFRRELLRGTVHDPSAAMMGGVGGHAGLFGSAGDLAKLLQMNLQGGYYGGVRYLVPETIRLFTSQTDSLNRRGLGWDKPDKNAIYGYISKYATAQSYGHSGYTGTVAWVEPSKELIIIFLSNRVHPNDNPRIIRQHTRRKIQDIVYESIIE
jgi:beta-glucosidase-like glycosyl hydrolase/CubicO group peptidase (beta-lactamase class C family)